MNRKLLAPFPIMADSPAQQPTPPPLDDPQEHPADDDLGSIDAAMAGEMDALLDGQFESVDDVLDGLFADHTAPLPSSGTDFDRGEREHEPTASVKQATFESPPPPLAPAARLAASAPPAPAHERAVAEDGDIAPWKDGQSGAVPDLIVPTAKHNRMTEGEVDSSLPSAAAKDASEQPAPKARSDERRDIAAAPSEVAPVRASVPQPDLAEPQAERGAGRGAGQGAGRRGLLVAVAVAVLLAMNMPLRLLPETVRPLVDWIALSLVFWVPVTWVIALLVIGR